MTYITKLYLDGFKSFAKPTTLEFGNDFNCFIGANGSGKTNLADAIVFVLGSLSPKTMRAEKAANLIFNGGKKGAPMKEAEVSIFFDNEKKEFPLDHRDIKVSRVIKQNGNSVYKINNDTATRQQVLDLLSHANVDPDGHNIVLQGDIVKLAEIKPEERRQVIEDIAGISIYEDKKSKALSELGKVDSKLNEAEIILTERRTYLKELKKDRDQALKYRELEKNIKSSKATVLHNHLKDKEAKQEEVDKRLQSYNDEAGKISKKINDIKAEIDSKKQEIQKLNKDIEEKGEVEVVRLQKEIEELKTTAARKSERMNTVQHELSRLQERSKQLHVSSKDTDRTMAMLETSKKEIESKVQHLEKKSASLAEEIKQFRERHHLGDATELSRREQELEQLQAELQEMQHSYNSALQKKFQYDAQIKALEDKLGEIQKFEDTTDLKALKQALKKTLEELQRSLNEDAALAVQLNRARVTVNEKNTELYKLQAKTASYHEIVASDIALKKILSMKKPGVFGLVTALGEIDPKYTLALEVAAGARIKSIIVDTDKTAADCIKILKEGKLGTCIFLPLNTIKPVPKAGIAGNGIIANALDLIRFDPKYKGAFSYIFASTLVVDDVEAARRLGIGRARMVTLEGDLFETSGAIIGGYRKARHGSSFKEKDINEKINHLEDEITQQHKLIDHLEKKRLQQENGITALREKKADMEAEIVKIERTSDVLNREEYEDQIKSIAKLDIFKEVKQWESRILQQQESYDKLKKERDKFRQSMKDLSNPEIAENLRKLEDSKSQAREQVIQLKTEVKNIEVQLASIYLPEKEKTIAIIKQHEREYEQFLQERQDLEKELRENSAMLKEKIQQESIFQKDFKNLFVQRNKLAEEIAKREAAAGSEQSKLREVENKINNANITRAKIVAELEAVKQEFEPYQGVQLRKSISEEELKSEIRKFEHLMQQMGNVNLRALEIYESIEKEYEELLQKAEKLKVEKEDVLKMMQEIESKKKHIFMKTFREVAKNFENIFISLSTKGQAFLELENKEEPLAGGIEIRLKMQGNKYLDIRSMSGGEKTLVALAFIFAIQEHQPASFYLLDEIDAALDKENSDLLSKLIGKYSQNAQYVVISHNDTVITEAKRIYGVAMQENSVSKVVSLKL